MMVWSLAPRSASSERVAEPVRGDRGAAVGIDQARSLTGITRRIVEQVKGRHWPITTEEEIPHLRPGPLVEQRPLRSTAPQRNDRAKRLSSFFVERHDPLPQRLPCRDAEPRCAVRVNVEAVDREPADLAMRRTRPAGDEQRCALIWTGQACDGRHETSQLVGRNVARDAVRCPRHIPVIEQRPARHIRPAPGDRIPEERDDGRDARPARIDRQRSSRQRSCVLGMAATKPSAWSRVRSAKLRTSGADLARCVMKCRSETT
jgi:hypothetical protein